MWVTEGRYKFAEPQPEERLQETTRLLAQMASDMPGYKETRLYVSRDGLRFTCVSYWDSEASASTYESTVLRRGGEIVERLFSAQMLSASLMRRVAGYTADDFPPGG